jgi:glutamyl-tRNA synthetase
VPLLRAVGEGLANSEDWNAGAVHQVLDSVARRNDTVLGKVAQPLRVAISGTAVSPPIDVTVALVGRAKALARVQRAIHHASAATV